MTEEWNLCAKCVEEVLTVYPKSVLSPKYIIYKTGECRWCKKKAKVSLYIVRDGKGITRSGGGG